MSQLLEESLELLAARVELLCERIKNDKAAQEKSQKIVGGLLGAVGELLVSFDGKQDTEQAAPVPELMEQLEPDPVIDPTEESEQDGYDL